MNTGVSMKDPTLRSAAPVQLAPARWTEDLWLLLIKGWEWLRRHSKGLLARQASRRLRTIETLSLGEKRFISIVEVDGEQFLLGGSSSTVVLLAKLEGGAKEQTFAEVLQQASERAENSTMNLTIAFERGEA